MEEKDYSDELTVNELMELEKYCDDPFILGRISKMYQCYKEEEERKALYKQSKKADLKFSLKYDKELTPTMKKAISDFWKRYSFAFPNIPEVCQTYYNRSGIFDPSYFHNGMRKYLHSWSCPEKYRVAFQNKSYLEKLFTNAKVPVTIIRKIDTIYFDSEWNQISFDEAQNICINKFRENSELVIKVTSAKGGGTGVKFIEKCSKNELSVQLYNYSGDYLIQEPIKQNDVLNKFNRTSINTLRLTTLLWEGKVIPLATLLRVGQLGSRLDNHVQGGYIIGVSNTGYVYNWALNNKNEKIDIMPSGLDLKEPIQLPMFQDAIDMAVKTHLDIPYIKLISWDICFTPDSPLIIECNFGGDLRLHQAVTGPIFGEYSKLIYDQILLHKFYKNRANLTYDYKEYANFVIITSYVGTDTEVIVPPKINGKPVIRIEQKAFYRKTNLKSVTIPDTLKWIDSEAFRGCKNLESVYGGISLKKIGKLAFKGCSSLKNFNISEDTEVVSDSFDGCNSYCTSK